MKASRANRSMIDWRIPKGSCVQFGDVDKTYWEVDILAKEVNVKFIAGYKEPALNESASYLYNKYWKSYNNL